MMHEQSLCRAAFYARVSSDQQAEAGTIDSQVAALEERMRQDGFGVDPELSFIDDGYTGSTLVRPALERLRDAASNGVVERLYVQAPDRLARSYVHQVLLVDELQRCGVVLVFLNRAVGDTPEDQLLLQVQGVVAEYERAKILERSRRGRLHAARQGRINVLAGSAPYGYRYVSKQEGGGQARYEVVWDEARIVQQLFRWVGEDRLTIGEAARRLTQQGVPTRTGKQRWDRSTVFLLTIPAEADKLFDCHMRHDGRSVGWDRAGYGSKSIVMEPGYDSTWACLLHMGTTGSRLIPELRTPKDALPRPRSPRMGPDMVLHIGRRRG
jgi:site-specific DNA recombinase